MKALQSMQIFWTYSSKILVFKLLWAEEYLSKITL